MSTQITEEAREASEKYRVYTNPRRQWEAGSPAAEYLEQLFQQVIDARDQRHAVEMARHDLNLTERTKSLELLRQDMDARLEELSAKDEENERLKERLEIHAFELSPAMVQARNDQLNAERNALRADNERLLSEKQQLCNVASSLRSQLEAVTMERDELAADKARLDALDNLSEAYGFEDVHEGNEWKIGGPFSNIRKAIDDFAQEPCPTCGHLIYKSDTGHRCGFKRQPTNPPKE